jgi:hypothetical protein
MLVLVGITILFAVHVFGVYWCYKNGDLIRPLVMLPPKEIPPFWHAIFVILVNGIFFSLMMLEFFFSALTWHINFFCSHPLISVTRFNSELAQVVI